MATVTVKPGDQITLDPNDKKVVVFDFDALNLATGASLTSQYVITIDGLRVASQSALLTKDNDSRTGSNRKIQMRLLATTATLGDLYRVSVKGVTDESPAQEKEYSITVLIQDH